MSFGWELVISLPPYRQRISKAHYFFGDTLSFRLLRIATGTLTEKSWKSLAFYTSIPKIKSKLSFRWIHQYGRRFLTIVKRSQNVTDSKNLPVKGGKAELLFPR